MRYQDASHVLAVCAAYDNRQPSQAAATTWAADLGQISREEAAQAVREYYRETPDGWVKPGHVIAIVKRHRRTGLAHSARLEAAMLRDVDPDDPGAVITAIHRARAMAATDGATVPTSRAALGTGKHEHGDRLDRLRRGRALVDAALAEHQRGRQTTHGEPAPMTRSEQILTAARERARAEKASRRRGDPERLSAVIARVRRTPNTGDIDV